MPTPSTWRCSVCRCTPAAASRLRRRLGLPRLRRDAAVCSPACRCEAARRRDRRRRGPASTARPRLPAGWRCAACGCSAAAADLRRRRAGRWQLLPTAKTCSRACWYAHALALRAAPLAGGRRAAVRSAARSLRRRPRRAEGR